MINKIQLLKILFTIMSILTVCAVWIFTGYVSQDDLSNKMVSYKTDSSGSSSSSIILSSSKISSTLTRAISSSMTSSSIQSSSTMSSLSFPILDNNIDLVKDVELIIQKPDPKIQALIKAAKDRPKIEVKSSSSEGLASVMESNSKI
jgi:hypothetical protein